LKSFSPILQSLHNENFNHFTSSLGAEITMFLIFSWEHLHFPAFFMAFSCPFLHEISQKDSKRGLNCCATWLCQRGTPIPLDFYKRLDRKKIDQHISK